MSFKANDSQQLSLDDSFIMLTARERNALEKSWAKIFADEIFPAIDEERFSVLYSDKASSPNTPVNVIMAPSLSRNFLTIQMMRLLRILCLISTFNMLCTPQALRNSRFRIKP